MCVPGSINKVVLYLCDRIVSLLFSQHVCMRELHVPSQALASVAELEKHLGDANILITTPFHPAYMTQEKLEKAKNLKLIMTAGVGSDHIDLQTAADKGMTVVEVTGVVPCSLQHQDCLIGPTHLYMCFAHSAICN